MGEGDLASVSDWRSSGVSIHVLVAGSAARTGLKSAQFLRNRNIVRIASYISSHPVILPRSGHHRDEIVWMNEFIPETRVGLRIENLPEPVDDDLMSIRITKLLVIGQPEIGVMADADIDRDQRRTQRDRRGWQEAYASASFYRIQNADA